MSKHDEFGTALPRLAPVAPRAMAITPYRAAAPAVAIVARPSSIAPVAPIAPVPHIEAPMAMTPAQLAAKAFATVTPQRLPSAAPQLLATPMRPRLDIASRPAADPVIAAITSSSGQEAAAKAASLITGGPSVSPDMTVSPLNRTPAALAAQAFGPDTSGNGIGAPGPADGGGSAVVDDGGGNQDWSVFDDSSSVAPTATTDARFTVRSTTPMPLAGKAAAVAVPVKESFWTRLLALFGFGKKTTASVHGERAEPNSTRAMVESVVRRARNGDQNAMALIALVRDNAKKGHGKAQETYSLLQEYIRTNPVGNNPRIVSMGLDPDYVALTQAPGTRWAGDPSDGTFHDAVALSHGPKLTNERIAHMLARFGHEERKAIHHGMKHMDSPNTHDPHVRIGKILSHARRLQAVRMHGSSLSKFDPRVGMELDE